MTKQLNTIAAPFLIYADFNQANPNYKIIAENESADGQKFYSDIASIESNITYFGEQQALATMRAMQKTNELACIAQDFAELHEKGLLQDEGLTGRLADKAIDVLNYING